MFRYINKYTSRRFIVAQLKFKRCVLEYSRTHGVNTLKKLFNINITIITEYNLKSKECIRTIEIRVPPVLVTCNDIDCLSVINSKFKNHRNSK